jgi:ribosomal protein S18 acetylase RimI-like enzyme
MAASGPEIRQARADEADAVCALWTEAFVGDEPDALSEPYDRRDYTDTIEVATVFVVDGDGGPIACVSLFDSDHPGVNDPGEAEISRLAVTARARRQGVGRALLEHCHEVARARGNRAMVLWSGPHQTAGHRLYESLGYERALDRDSDGEDGRSRLVFVRSLD